MTRLLRLFVTASFLALYIATPSAASFTINVLPSCFIAWLDAGQSNNYFSAPNDPAIDTGQRLLFQYGTNAEPLGVGVNSIVPAIDPLDQVDGIMPNHMGYVVAFFRDYYIPNVSLGGCGVLVIPNALGSHGFESFQPGQPLYIQMVARSQAVLALSGVTWGGVLFQDGEASIPFDSTSQAQTLILNMIRNFIVDVPQAANKPIIVGGMPQFYYTNYNSGYPAMFAGLPAQQNYVGYGDATNPSPLGGPSDAHWTPPDSRTFAGRMWTGYQQAIANH